ncbi:RNA polymerase sigma factor [Rubripirellula reticaptiva]|uniref:RNA polymerase sigma factor SigK n=1 Tax=Rubripirellula reticaptiva TaxID=2528013 RepID=A0A5C6ESN1_9BACT|nr:sigma-70 family RNA polymerase sigma factor [Rubripirellula reticaptiva]TWU51364.1 RNA polymerase sigma factor SigK [Rubripirellula reticaptiva]
MPSPQPAPLSKISPTDQTLVCLVRDGDEDAAEQLYDRYARRVFGLVDAKLGAHLRELTEPEDIVQSVFRSIFRGVRAGNYDAPPGKTLWSLLAVVSVSKLVDRANYHSAQCRDSHRNAPLVDGNSRELETDPRAHEFLKLCVEETLATLRPIEQEIMTLRIAGHTIEDISETVGRSVRTVERTLQNTRQKLASQLLNDATAG